jgi:hypothetical protein
MHAKPWNQNQFLILKLVDRTEIFRSMLSLLMLSWSLPIVLPLLLNPFTPGQVY